MSNYGDAAAGLKTVLEANVTGLHAYTFPVSAVHEFPAAVILPEPLDPQVAFNGNSFEAAFRVVFLVCSADETEGFSALYDHIDPTETNKSVIKAVRTDPTLNAKVDDAEVTRIENVGRRELWGSHYFGFDALVSFIKTVA